jgi:hypothetical protein
MKLLAAMGTGGAIGFFSALIVNACLLEIAINPFFTTVNTIYYLILIHF